MKTATFAAFLHRLDVTLWGCWLATGCAQGLELCAGFLNHDANCGPTSASGKAA